MCGLWVVPAALPDLPGDGGGGALAAGPNRGHARRAMARQRGRRRLRPLHVDLRAMPRVRAGVSERCSVRSPHGRHPRGVGGPSQDHALVATAGISRARSPSPPARWFVHARCRSTAAPRAGPARSGPAAVATRGVRRADGRGDMAVHWLRDGCVDAWYAPVHRCGARRDGCHVFDSACSGRVLRSVARACRVGGRRSSACRAGDDVDAGRCTNPGEFQRGAAPR